MWVLGSILAVGGLVLPWLAWTTAAHFDDTLPAPGGRTDWLPLVRERGWPTAVNAWMFGYAGGVLVLFAAVVVPIARRRARRGPLAGQVKHLPTDRPGLQRYLQGTGPLIGRVINGRNNRGPMVRMTTRTRVS